MLYYKKILNDDVWGVLNNINILLKVVWNSLSINTNKNKVNNTQ